MITQDLSHHPSESYQPPPLPPNYVRCEVMGGNRCTICGGMFGDSAEEIVCQSGHLIGESYPVPR